ncbi:MAG: DsbA family protein [Candidatus Nanohaloarchaea archaeon]
MECKYCDKEFESEREMYLHWGEEHSEELNSHDEEKLKKARREKEEEENARMEWRRKMMIRGIGGLVIVALVYVSAPAIIGMFTGGQTIDFDDLNLEEQPMLGEEDANVTIVEFGDFMCSACRDFNQETKPTFQDHIEQGNVKMYYIDFPLPNFRPENIQAATAAECVYQQDNQEYWSLHDELFSQQGMTDYSDSGLLEFTKEHTEGLNYTEVEACMQSEETVQSVRDDRELGQKNSISQTPTVFIDGEMISDRSNIDSIIQDKLE